MIVRSVISSLVVSLMLASPLAAAPDEAAALALLNQSKCMSCHSVEKKKDGPAYKEVALKYKDDAEAEAKLIKHMTEPSKVKIDGEEEDHGIVKTRDMAKIKNLVAFILSR